MIHLGRVGMHRQKSTFCAMLTTQKWLVSLFLENIYNILFLHSLEKSRILFKYQDLNTGFVKDLDPTFEIYPIQTLDWYRI